MTRDTPTHRHTNYQHTTTPNLEEREMTVRFTLRGQWYTGRLVHVEHDGAWVRFARGNFHATTFVPTCDLHDNYTPETGFML